MEQSRDLDWGFKCGLLCSTDSETMVLDKVLMSREKPTCCNHLSPPHTEYCYNFFFFIFQFKNMGLMMAVNGLTDDILSSAVNITHRTYNTVSHVSWIHPLSYTQT